MKESERESKGEQKENTYPCAKRRPSLPSGLSGSHAEPHGRHKRRNPNERGAHSFIFSGDLSCLCTLTSAEDTLLSTGSVLISANPANFAMKRFWLVASLAGNSLVFLSTECAVDL